PERVGSALPPPLPDTTGWGVHVLALARPPEGGLWAGTYGRGIFVLQEEEREWSRIAPASGDATGLSSGFVNSLAFTESGAVWYGTVGSGFGTSSDSGRTWRNWGIDELGPEWLYVTAHGIVARGDTVYIATADGLRITRDGGATWLCVEAEEGVAGGSPERDDGCTERTAGLANEYLLSLDVGPDGEIWAGHLEGLSLSLDGGRSWRQLDDADGIPAERFRAIAVNSDSIVWAASETDIYVDSAREGEFTRAELTLPGWPGLPGAPRALIASPAAVSAAPGVSPPSIVTSFGLAAAGGTGLYRIYYLGAGESYKPAADMWDMTWWGPPLWPIGGSAAGLNRVLAGESRPAGQNRATRASAPADPPQPWFGRPIALEGANPYIDATYLYGSTMGGTFQQHMGVEFNNPAGTPVHAIGDGVVVFAGAAEAGSNIVAIRHDQRAGESFIFSTYYHNSSLEVQSGQQVHAGDVIARVGNTGRATNDHLHLEVHVAPTQDSAVIVNPDERFPPHTVNPQLWIEPMPGTGIVAGRVTDGSGQPVAGARIYGLVQPYPEETPFSFAETYGDRSHASPGYDENFAIGDIPAGDYRIGVEIDGTPVWRRITVEAGKVTFVEFQP
ncbi:MAG: peptidoglycan DD-metalloendopeptidase family protein, partial [Longimicrobiales bacterium]